jgi:hypothetical protein
MRAIQHNRSEIGRAALTAATMHPVHTKGGIYLGHAPAFGIDGERVNTIFAAIVRGLYYEERGQRIPDDYTFEVRRFYPWDCHGIRTDAFKAMNWNRRRPLGDTFSVAYLSAAEDPMTSLWHLTFYGRVEFSVYVTNPAMADSI